MLDCLGLFRIQFYVGCWACQEPRKAPCTMFPTARFMTVQDYIDSNHPVWRRRWFDFTSAAAHTFNIGQCVVVVRDTPSLFPEIATIHCLVTHRVHLQCRKQRQSLILHAQGASRSAALGGTGPC